LSPHFDGGTVPLSVSDEKKSAPRSAPVVTAKCPACEHLNPPWRGSCESCKAPLDQNEPDSDPTWPAPDERSVDEQPAPSSRVSPERIERLRRIVRGLDVTIESVGEKLTVTIELQHGRSERGDLPMEIGVKVFETIMKYYGPPDTWITLARPTAPIRVSIPARGLKSGDAAVVSLSWADTREEIQTLVR
jgi:hypothetical protein